MTSIRREFLKVASAGFVAAAKGATARAYAEPTPPPIRDPNAVFDTRAYGARGDGVTIDTRAVSNAIAAANNRAGGTVRFPPGIYACYSIHLKRSRSILSPEQRSSRPLFLQKAQGAKPTMVLESNSHWEDYQDYGRNHWHNSLRWGKDIREL